MPNEPVDEPPEEEQVDERYLVPGLLRGLAVLQLFTRESPELTLSEIAAKLELSRAAAYRLVYTLQYDGFLHRNARTRHYRVTSKILMLGFDYLQSQSLADIGQSVLARVSEQTRAVSHLVMLDGWQIVYLARWVPAGALLTNIQIGSRLPAHLSSTGRILLSALDETRLRWVYAKLEKAVGPSSSNPLPIDDFIKQAFDDRKRGYVYQRSHVDPGVFSLACPVFDRSGATIAAINSVGSKAHFDSLGGESVLHEIVRAGALEISLQQGFRPAVEDRTSD